MKQKSKEQLSKPAMQELHGSSARERLLHRLHSVALVVHGLSASEAARIYSDSPRAVAYWVKRFKEDGVDGLHEEARPGRPSTLSKSQLQGLRTFVERSIAHGKPMRAATVSGFLEKEYGVELTTRQCLRILKQLKP